MKHTKNLIVVIFTIIYFSSCSTKTDNEENTNEVVKHETNYEYNVSQNTDVSTETNATTEVDRESDSSPCKLSDGTYSASVDYSNSETGYSASYTLDVEVQDCQVVQINFPNDGYLDEDHISYADIDENGNASVDGEDGKSYEIQIDN